VGIRIDCVAREIIDRIFLSIKEHNVLPSFPENVTMTL
jgi:hypothetical protein